MTKHAPGSNDDASTLPAGAARGGSTTATRRVGRSARLRWPLQRAALVALCGAAAGLVACSSTPPPEAPEKCDLQIVTSAVITSPYINPSERGEPRPVQVRIYQLKSDVGFLNADFDEVWKKDAEVLGEDLVKGEEFPVYPNTRTEVKFERDEAAQFIVAAALFRNPTGKTWYQSFELPPSPADGDCGARCPEGDCPEEPVLDPSFYIWIDDTRVEDGIEYAEFFPEGGTLAATPTETEQ